MVELLQNVCLRQELPPGLLGAGAAVAVVGAEGLHRHVESAAEFALKIESNLILSLREKLLSMKTK
jgi:hypothetical protein